MSTDVQGRALAVLNRVAQADWPDRFNLRKPFEKLLYSGSRTGFRLASERSAKQAKGPRKADPDGLFDLSFSDDQQMLVDMLEGFALEVLRPLAHDADAEASLPAELLNQALELGLTHYGVGEVHGGMAGERTTVTTALIAEALAKDLNMPREVTRRWVGEARISPVVFGPEVAATLQTAADFFHAEGVLPKSLEVAPAFDFSLSAGAAEVARQLPADLRVGQR